MPTSTPTLETFTKPAKDAFYMTVGLGVMAYEQLRSNQSELCSWFETQVADGKAQFETQAGQIEERFEELLESVQSKLPEQAAEIMKQARDAAKSAREQLKDLVARATPSQSAAA
jgi:hypothetical protein